MKSRFFLVLIAALALSSCKKTDTPVVTPPVKTITPYIPTGWKALTAFTGTRTSATAIAIGDKIYTGLGYNNATGYSTVTNDWYLYDPASNTWTAKTSFPGEARANAISFVINGKGYIGMGTNYDRTSKGATYLDFYEYDPSMDKWTKKANFPASGRDQSVFFSIGSKGYMGTGNTDPFSAASVTSDFWEYDPAVDKWTKKADFIGIDRCRSFGFSANGKGYIGAGENATVIKQRDFYEYDPTTDKWSLKADFPVALARSRGFSFNNLGYVLGGVPAANVAVNTIYKYNPTTNTWVTIGEVASEDDSAKGRLYQVAAPTATKVYIGLGASGDPNSPTNKKDFYEYTPQ